MRYKKKHGQKLEKSEQNVCFWCLLFNLFRDERNYLWLRLGYRKTYFLGRPRAQNNYIQLLYPCVWANHGQVAPQNPNKEMPANYTLKNSALADKVLCDSTFGFPHAWDMFGNIHDQLPQLFRHVGGFVGLRVLPGCKAAPHLDVKRLRCLRIDFAQELITAKPPGGICFFQAIHCCFNKNGSDNVEHAEDHNHHA